jgi:hypothetical protein
MHLHIVEFLHDANTLPQTAKPEDTVTISAGFTLKMGSFARLAQATYLSSQSLRIITSKSSQANVQDDDQAAQLRRTQLALVHATDSEAEIRKLEFCAQTGVSFR